MIADDAHDHGSVAPRPSSTVPRMRLVERRSVWFPTFLGLFCIAVVLLGPIVWWLDWGESFLSLTRRLPAEVLVVEGWIGRNGVRAAATEFGQHGYQYVVAAGGPRAGDRWDEGGLSYAEAAAQELIESGVPKSKIIVAPSRNTVTHRTYESAVAVWGALQTRGIHPNALNVFTLGPHARRSRLVFAKVQGSATKVGVVDWTPNGQQTAPWWRSSDRAKALLTETAGYFFEALLNSGRASNSPEPAKLPDLVMVPDSTAKVATPSLK
jgi:hypothetical protein